jgi:hypothetical protein
MLPHGFFMPVWRDEKSRGGYLTGRMEGDTFGGVTVGLGGVQTGCRDVGTMGLRPMSASTSPAQLNCTGSCGTGSTIVRFEGDGARSTGVGSVGTVLVHAVLAGLTAASPGSGLMGETGAALVRAVRMGSTETSPGTGLMGAGSTGLGCGVLCAMGLRPRASLTSATPSNRAGLCSVVVSNMALAVGDGVSSRTSF